VRIDQERTKDRMGNKNALQENKPGSVKPEWGVIRVVVFSSSSTFVIRMS
jgi:hypothetical protein